MKTLGAIAIVICLAAAGCGYHDHYRHYDRYGRRSEIQRAQEDFRRAGWEAREDLQRARRDLQRELRQAREEFRREMREAHRDFRDEFGRW
jgi:uncharacterized protein HemX